MPITPEQRDALAKWLVAVRDHEAATATVNNAQAELNRLAESRNVLGLRVRGEMEAAAKLIGKTNGSRLIRLGGDVISVNVSESGHPFFHIVTIEEAPK